MAAAELFYDPTSEPCRAVQWFALETGVPIVLRYTWLTRDDHLNPEYGKINPRHQVPALRDGTFCLSEATAIMSYLAETGSAQAALGTTPRDRARINMLFSWYHINLRQVLTSYYLPVLLLPAYQGDALPSAVQIENLRGAVRAAFAGIEVFLGDKPFLCGDRAGAPDFLFAPEIFALDCDPHRETLFGTCPKLGAWLTRLRERETYKVSHKAWNAVAQLIQNRLRHATTADDPAWVAETCKQVLGLR